MEDSGELIDLKKSKIDNSTAVVENGTIVVSITNGDKTDVKVYEMQDGNSKIKEDKNGNRLNQSNQEIDEADNEKISDLLVKDSNSNKINDKDNKKPESANDSDKEGKGSNKIVVCFYHFCKETKFSITFFNFCEKIWFYTFFIIRFLSSIFHQLCANGMYYNIM